MTFGNGAAAHDREAISARIKAALAAAKARGVKLGGSNLRLAQYNGAKANKSNADSFAANVLPIIQKIKASGVTSLRAIAAELEARGIRTARGGKWAAQQVRGILRRADNLVIRSGPTAMTTINFTARADNELQSSTDSGHRNEIS
jgi:DNA invertase Pin-like site-specific DNA recombinase